MAGSPKRMIARLRAAATEYLKQGDEYHYELYENQALWVEKRVQHKLAGGMLGRWDKKNPSPFKLAGYKDNHSPTQEAEFELGLESDLNHKRDIVKIDCLGDYVESARHIYDPNSKREFHNSTINKPIIISDVDRNLMLQLEEAKRKLKKKAEEPGLTQDELKTLVQLVKKVDADYKRIRYTYYFNEFDEYFCRDIQDRVDTPPFHLEMFQLFQTSQRACVVCPRGHAKSTNARKYLLNQIVSQKCQHILIIGASEEMAAQNLRWIRDQLTDNKRILEVYGNLKNNDKWAETEFEVVFKDKNGEPYWKCKVAAKGAGQKVRGSNEKGRPDLIYIDDLEEDEQVLSKERRDKLKHWLLKTLMPSTSRSGRIIITGTILHVDSLLQNVALNKYRDNLMWDVLFYSAIWKNSEGVECALWPDQQPLEKLLPIREHDSTTFAQEYQNNPRSGLQSVFNAEMYRHFDPEKVDGGYSRGFTYNGDRLHLMLTTDFAFSEKTSSDWTVYMVTGMDSKSNLYVLDYLRFRTSDPFEQINTLFELIIQYNIDYVVMEEQQYQHVIKRYLEKEMEDRNRMFYIRTVQRTTSTKLLRIKGLSAPVRKGMILWKEEHTELEDELNEVTISSLGAHDDVADCLADAWVLQVEGYEERQEKSVPINTMAWLEEQGIWDTSLNYV